MSDHDTTTDPADGIDFGKLVNEMDSNDTLIGTLDALACLGGRSISDRLGRQWFKEYEIVRLQAGKLNGRLAIWDPLKAERDRKRKGFTGRPGIIECPRDAALPELNEFMAKYQRALADNDGRVQFSIETRS
jgi:hypothetical protein